MSNTHASATTALSGTRPAHAGRERPEASGRRRRLLAHPSWRHLAGAIAVVFALAAAGVLVGQSTTGSLPSDLLGGTHTVDVEWTYAEILARNLGAALLAFGGVLTAGVVTAVTVPLIGVWVGATSRISIDGAGWDTVLSSTVSYAPLEFLGVAIAAAAGLLPLIHAMTPPGSARQEGFMRRYISALPSAITVLIVAVGIIVVAAGIEYLVISLH
ncbi:MAG: stage II sporulation protein M [Micrococcus sp.]|nr:stage II sporulation protein M [Micrococcus sp.]